ncbi:MAG: hypothetical protein WC989_03295 [Micavibrio sp.]
MNKTDIRFSSLGAPRRVWAVSAIHGELDRLYALHDAILERLQAGDRIVYLGNYTGYGVKSRETVDEIITFRRLALSQPGVLPTDIVYLRGTQEDMWQRLLQLQFTNKPELALTAMLAQGLDATLESYGLDAYEGMRACKEGVLALTRWAGKIRETIRANPGHETFLMQYKRAAYTGENGHYPLLFVHAGINPALALDHQDDSFWTYGENFDSITQAYAPFGKVIRGYDPAHGGVRINCVTASLDGGSGFGGNLVAARMDGAGRMLELLQA